LQGRAEESRGRCPFEPTAKHASVFIGMFGPTCNLKWLSSSKLSYWILWPEFCFCMSTPICSLWCVFAF